MARKTLIEVIADTKVSFNELSRQVDQLEVGEQTMVLDPRESLVVVRRLKELARNTSATLNSAAPVVGSDQADLFRATSGMLSELAMADNSEIFFQRFQDRREDIDSGLIKLGE